ncbi:nodulin / glutamate-ammonia ligase-like protein [Leucobacter sp. 7(1)]|uniref:amidohydrolase family protein n=1 Tax=Leucobacter sp. 7(1) TaxID=1255613 RepID=UPI00097F5936|nr:amidohydrolase family protein [Leucobacter sp. 7(1)]SJN11001.1 nodulin / glutamate-ammonia ligase-like protein [Leucobacter sp. 7(1)]
MSQTLLTPAAFAAAELVDHHCHGVVEHTLERREFESLITESNWDAPEGTSVFDSQLGTAIRRWCAPLLDLDAHITAERYLERRAELEPRDVNERLLRAAGIDRYLIETGYRGDDILTAPEMAHRADAASDTVVRLERLAEQLVVSLGTAAEYADAFRAHLAEELKSAVGVKTIAAYRLGLDFDPARPSDAEVTAAAGEWLREIGAGGEPRLEHAVLIRFGIWCAVDAQQAIQFHIGFGDPDVDLHRCDPLLLTEWLRLTRNSGARVLLLHCYPFHRNAGYLAHVFPHVYCDVGLAINYVGAASPQVISESLELTPFDKVLFSSDAFGLPELYFLGAHLFRRGVTQVINGWIENDEWDVDTGERLVRKICGENAMRAYKLTPGGAFGAGRNAA